MTNVATTANDIVVDYSELGNYIGLCTGNPGGTSSPQNEASGGTPAYARQATTWLPSGQTAIGSAVTINVPTGTYSYMILCSGSSGSNMIDWCAIPPQTATTQTTITITPLITVS